MMEQNNLAESGEAWGQQIGRKHEGEHGDGSQMGQSEVLREKRLNWRKFSAC